MNELNGFSQYCVGCGLCKALNKGDLFENSKGFYELANGDIDWLKKVCPYAGKQTDDFFGTIWGKYEKIFLGWSTDNLVRNKASSGGIITEISSYLLENSIVDAVIHTTSYDFDPTKTVSCISKTREELIKRCGSRYSISHPLEIMSQLDLSKKYVFIGKPCDVDVLSNFLKFNEDYQDSIIITISFFCAGLPSNVAQTKLLKEIGCKKEKCISLKYRGDGWPGYATALDNDGNKYQMDYDTSWGTILGRDVMPMCRFCLNGVGETADISCGDAWYLTQDGHPDFSEHEGRNIIFARTKLGQRIVESAEKNGNIIINSFENSEQQLKQMQYYQYNRRESMISKRLAMKLFGKQFPKYPRSLLRRYSKNALFSNQVKVFKGTVSRILRKTIK